LDVDFLVLGKPPAKKSRQALDSPGTSRSHGWAAVRAPQDFQQRTAMKLLSAETSEEAIDQLAQRRLRESPYFFLKSLECHFADGVLTLRGRVPYAPLKKFAETIVWRIDGVHDVVNRIEVQDPMRATFNGPAARNAG
jgi:osmotically-inducible protein OsmY